MMEEIVEKMLVYLKVLRGSFLGLSGAGGERSKEL